MHEDEQTSWPYLPLCSHSASNERINIEINQFKKITKSIQPEMKLLYNNNLYEILVIILVLHYQFDMDFKANCILEIRYLVRFLIN